MPDSKPEQTPPEQTPPEQTPPEQTAPAPTEPDGRARLRAALLTPGSRGQVIAAVLLAVLGFAAVTQVRSTGRDDAFVGARQGDLIQYINTLSLATQRAESEIAKLQATREALGNDAEARRTALARTREQATTLGILAGTIPATGPGVEVRVTDRRGGVGTNQLLNGLEELRDAGAEVITIGSAAGKGATVRVIASTSLQDTANGGVLVDGTRLRAPFVLAAIGDPHTLDSALGFSGGFTSQVHGVGGDVSVRRVQQLQVTAVREPHKPTLAKPTTR